MPLIKRGEIWQVDLGLAAKVRPCLVLNVDFTAAERALYTVVPHTTSERGGRFEVRLAVRALRDGAFDVQGLRPVPPNVFLNRRAVLTKIQMTQIEFAVSQWLGLEQST